MESSRDQYVVITDAHKGVLVSHFNDGMTSTKDMDKINSAAESTGLTIQRIKKWIGNQKAKERKRANQNVVDGKQDVVPQKISKGERKVAARSVFYRHLSKEGKLVGFKNNAERNVYFASEWETIDEEEREKMEAEATRINENRGNEMTEEEKMSAIKRHKKKLLRQISILESFGVETTVAMADGDRLTHLGSEKGLAFFTAHPSFSDELLKYYEMAENEKQYSYKDLQTLFNRSYSRAIKCDNARVPYLNGNFSIEGMPENVGWRKVDGSVKKPTDYGQKQINEIMLNKEDIKFVIASQEEGEEVEHEITEEREQASVPACMLKLVSPEVATRAMNQGAQIREDEVDVLVQIREDESEVLLRDFGHFFSENAKHAVMRNNLFGRGVIFPVYTRNKRQFWLFHYQGTVSEIENAPPEATIPGKWLDHESGCNYKILKEITSIKKINVICGKHGKLLSVDHHVQDSDDTIKVNKDFLKIIKETLKLL